ncbi:MAG: glcg protein [Candidatus Puniceispirillum sp. TMED52]|nr:glcg protein [SAR116 cluster bacterium]OUU47351.1 MAG: glcg protein [Candidatus Puniceispirillum sp. TMED52]
MLTLNNANTISTAALAEARKMNLKPISVVVLDHRAATISIQSEDGVCIMRSDIAKAKANAAIQLGMGTRALMMRAEQQAYFVDAVNGLGKGNIIPVPGGVLVKDSDGNTIGAVGISGDTSDNDESAAIAGINAAGLTADAG